MTNETKIAQSRSLSSVLSCLSLYNGIHKEEYGHLHGTSLVTKRTHKMIKCMNNHKAWRDLCLYHSFGEIVCGKEINAKLYTIK